MNRIREIAKQQGRKLSWLAEQIELDRRALDWRLKNDSFTPGQREVLAGALGVAVDELFPEVDASVEVA